MLNLFKKPKIDVTKLHQQYRDKKINQAEYSNSIYQALCEYLIPDETKKKMDKAGINMLDPQENFTPRCDKKTLIEIEKELRIAARAIHPLLDALKEIKPNEKYKQPSEQYQGKNILSHKEWAKFREQVTARTLHDSHSTEEIYEMFIRSHFLSIRLMTHTIVLNYMGLIFGGATII